MVGLSNKEINFDEDDFTISPMFNKTTFSKESILFHYDTCLLKLTDKKIENEKIKEKANSFIVDKEYIKLNSCSIKECVYEFNVDKWLASAFSKAKLEKNLVNFEKQIKLSKKIPKMVEETNSIDCFSKFVSKKIKDYINKNSKLKKDLQMYSVETIGKKLGINLYQDKYDYYLNKIILSIKPEYINTLLAYISLDTKKEKEKVKTDFDKSVYTFLKVTSPKR